MKVIPRHIAVALVLTAIRSWAYGWDDVGHQVVAQIALDTLKSSDAHAKLLEIVNKDPRKSDRPTILSFATWPDLIKHRDDTIPGPIDPESHAYRDGNWHFVDVPYDLHGQDINRFLRPPGKTVDVQHNNSATVVTAIEFYSKRLADPSLNDQDRADALSWLIHLVGDVHQPLHCVDRNDIGGNKVKIVWPTETHDPFKDNLHSLWDDFLDIKDHAPFDAAKIQQIATSIASSHPASSFAALNESDAGKWAQESYDLRKLAYSLTPEQLPTDEYRSKLTAVGSERIALAGYRLARLLDQILGTPSAGGN